MQDRTLDGYWWQPGKEDARVAGVATYDGGSPNLRLIGALTYEVEHSPGVTFTETSKKFPMLMGSCLGEQVTLLECRQIKLQENGCPPSEWRQTFSAKYMLVGVWLDEPEENYFDELIVGIENLNQWSTKQGFDTDFGKIDGKMFASVSWQAPDEFGARVGEVDVELDLLPSRVTTTWADRVDAKITERAAFTITGRDLRPPQAFIQQWTRPLQDLLTLSMDRPCGLTEVRLVRRDPPGVVAEDSHPETDFEPDEIPDTPERSGGATEPEVDVEQNTAGQADIDVVAETDSEPIRPHIVDVYFDSIYRGRPETKQAPNPLFTLTEIEFADLLPVWFETYERFGPVVSMLLGHHYISRAFVENRMITAVAAAEGLHRRLLPSATYIDSDQFDEFANALRGVTPPEHVEWLNNRLWNEPTFKRRLEQLVEYVGKEILAPVMPKPNRWARKTTIARNLLVHRFEEDDQDEPLTGPQMYVLGDLTAVVTTFVVLKEIGLNDEFLKQLAIGHEPYRWLARETGRQLPWVFGIPTAR